jgi:hypothetical protein
MVSSTEGRISGRHAEDGTGCGARGRGLSPRTREASGPRPPPTTRGCLQWLDAVGTKAGESLPDRGARRALVPARKSRARGQKSPPPERREAPFPDRKGKGDASQASRAIAPIAQRRDRKGLAFPGAPLPSPFKGARISIHGVPGAGQTIRALSHARSFPTVIAIHDAAPQAQQSRFANAIHHGCAGHRRSGRTPFFERLCPRMTRRGGRIINSLAVYGFRRALCAPQGPAESRAIAR